MAELVHTRQVAHQTADIEAGRVAALAKTAEKEAKAKEALLQHQQRLEKLHEHKHHEAATTATTPSSVDKASAKRANNNGNLFLSNGSCPTSGKSIPILGPAALPIVNLNWRS